MEKLHLPGTRKKICQYKREQIWDPEVLGSPELQQMTHIASYVNTVGSIGACDILIQQFNTLWLK